MSDSIELGPSPQASEMSCVGGQHIFRFSRVVGRGLSSLGWEAWPLILTSWAGYANPSPWHYISR